MAKGFADNNYRIIAKWTYFFLAHILITRYVPVKLNHSRKRDVIVYESLNKPNHNDRFEWENCSHGTKLFDFNRTFLNLLFYCSHSTKPFKN